jgi:5-oxoprolinase (ATP-hydrolysing)
LTASLPTGTDLKTINDLLERRAPMWDFWWIGAGTFTDVVARDPSGTLRAAKLLSENPGSLCRRSGGGDPPLPWRATRGGHSRRPDRRRQDGHHRGHNALLERKGERTALLITRGFPRRLAHRLPGRPDIFAKKIVLPELLYDRVDEIGERVRADGTSSKPRARRDPPCSPRHPRARFPLGGDRLHACLEIPEHERIAGRVAREMFPQVSLSHEVSPLVKLVGRGDTTVVDAYLTPVLRVMSTGAGELGVAPARGPRLMFMMSSGGLTDAALFQGKDAILSGPPAGVVGAIETARMAGLGRIIGFDMGARPPTCRTMTGSWSARSRRRWPACGCGRR